MKIETVIKRLLDGNSMKCILFQCKACLLLPLMQMAEGKLTYQHADAEEKSTPAKKRRREAARVEHARTVAEHFKPADVSSVKEVRYQFRVLSIVISDRGVIKKDDG